MEQTEAEFQFLAKLRFSEPSEGDLSRTSWMLQDIERPKLVAAYVRHFEEHEAKLFDKKTAERTEIFIREYGYEKPDYESIPDIDEESEPDNHGVRFRQLILPDIERLRSRLGWPQDGETRAGSHRWTRDPKCRFFVFHTMCSDTLLSLTKEMLFLILTYHQVSPCYLNFITCLGSSTGASDLRFGGFRSQRFLKPGGSAIGNLGRSGLHYQLSFRLQTIQKIDHREPVHQWRKHTAAVHHQFDIGSGTSLWILTAPLEQVHSRPKNYLWNNVKEHISKGNHGSDLESCQCSERFTGSLAVISALAEWSLGDCSFYLHHLEEKLIKVTNPYLYPLKDDDQDEDPTKVAKDVRNMTILIEDLQDCVIRLKDNKRVLLSLEAFYREEFLADADDPGLALNWKTQAEGQVKRLSAHLHGTIGEIDELSQRAAILDSLAKTKEMLVGKLLQNGQNRRMKEITEVTSEDSSAMRNFALITLALLPATVVSTVLSTDIVKFQNFQGNDTPGKDPSTPPPVFKFSPAAFATWAIAAFLLTLLCLAFSTAFYGPKKKKKTEYDPLDSDSLLSTGDTNTGSEDLRSTASENPTFPDTQNLSLEPTTPTTLVASTVLKTPTTPRTPATPVSPFTPTAKRETSTAGSGPAKTSAPPSPGVLREGKGSPKVGEWTGSKMLDAAVGWFLPLGIRKEERLPR